MAAFKSLNYDKVKAKIYIPPEEVQYWQNYKAAIVKQENGPITSIDINGTNNFISVTNSSKISLYNISDDYNVEKVFSRFKSAVYSCRFRHDSELITVGSEESVVRLFNVKTKSCLREFSGHTGGVHSSWFTADGHHIISASDDKTVKFWDIASGERLQSFNDHLDFVRCLRPSKTNHNLLISGSYDHNLRFYDVRLPKEVSKFNHKFPIEDVLFFPSDTLAVSAGGPGMKIWDLVAGKLLAELNYHSKTITSVCFAQNDQVIISAGLDRLIKMYNITYFNVIHTIQKSSSLLSIANSNDDRLLVCGTTDALVHIKPRKLDDDEYYSDRKVETNNYGYVKPISSIEPDIIIQKLRKAHAAKFEVNFRKFDYVEVLKTALSFKIRKNSPSTTITVLRELIRRRGIRVAILGIKDKNFLELLTFVNKNVTDPAFSSTLVHVIPMILDKCSSMGSMSPAITNALNQLKNHVGNEIRFVQLLNELHGMTQLFAASKSSNMSSKVVHKTVSDVLGITKTETGTESEGENTEKVETVETVEE